MQFYENKIFVMARKFNQLNAIERMGVMPKSEGFVLQVIINISEGEKGCRVSDIAKALEVSVPAISRTLKKLREKEFIESIINEKDRRNTYITITNKGRTSLERDLSKMNSLMKAVKKDLTEEELKEFCRIYDKIYESFKKRLDEIE